MHCVCDKGSALRVEGARAILFFCAPLKAVGLAKLARLEPLDSKASLARHEIPADFPRPKAIGNPARANRDFES
jgi:hypothetical protein